MEVMKMARRIEKEIYKLEQNYEIGKAFQMAKKAGYEVKLYDGDGENGPYAPELYELYVSRPTVNQEVQQ